MARASTALRISLLACVSLALAGCIRVDTAGPAPGSSHNKWPEIRFSFDDVSDAPINVRQTAAQVVVIPEDRTDFAVEITPGKDGVPVPTVEQTGTRVVVKGDLRGDARCTGQGVDIAGIGNVARQELPLITIRAPRGVDIGASGALFGTIGASSEVDLEARGCGSWQIAAVGGDVKADLAGSTQLEVAAMTGRLDVDLAGAGGLSVLGGEITDTQADVAGSGTLRLERVNGPVALSLAGSGLVEIAEGVAPTFEASIAGSGAVRFGGRADSADLSVAGSGSVNLAEAGPNVSQSIMGSGRVEIGNR